MNKLKFFAALCCAAMVFAACDKSDEPKNGSNNDDSKDGGKEQSSYTLTVRSNDETLGTVTGSGKYDISATVKIVATPAEGAEFISWSDDTVSVELEREIILTSDSTITATFSRVAVDLGLPSGLKWAPCNVGATKPEEYGNYYAWGETATKSDYSWDTYKYGSSSDALTKYCNDSSRGKDGFTDDLTTLEAADDAAAVNWGDAWRMPTDAEWQELIDNCDWIWTDDYNDTGVAGCIVASKTNGNAIFLPAAGSRDGGRPFSAGYSGVYWSSSLDLNSPDYARNASFYSDGVGRGSGAHRYGESVRAVHK